MNRPDFVFVNQASNRSVFDLAHRVAEQLGSMVVISGPMAQAPSHPRLQHWPATPYDNRTLPSRLRSWLRFLVDVVGACARIQSTPVLVVSTNPPLLPWLAWALKRTRGWPYVVHVLDVYPDAIVKLGLLDEGHPLIATWQHLNRLAFAEAHSVITLAPVMAESVGRYMSAKTGAPEIIPIWVDTEVMRPVPRSDNAFAREHGLQGKLVVMYSGNLGLTHDISGVIAAAEMLEGDERVHFVFVGGGARATELAAVAEKLANCPWLPFQPAEVVPAMIAAADVAIVTIADSGHGVSMPSKAATALAAGCALLTLSPPDSDLAKLIEEHRCGVNLLPTATEQIRDVLLGYAEDASLLRACQERARAAALERFSSARCTARFVDILAEARRAAD